MVLNLQQRQTVLNHVISRFCVKFWYFLIYFNFNIYKMEESKVSICENKACVSLSSVEDELKLTDEKYVGVIDQMKKANEELSKLKEQALVLSGARTILMKMLKKD